MASQCVKVEMEEDVQKGLQTPVADSQLNNILRDHNMLPSDSDIVHRKQMFEVIKTMIQRQDVDETVQTRLNFQFIIEPIGAYGMAVWDPSTEIDCLIIGALSPMVFWTLTIQKLHRPEYEKISVLKKTKGTSGMKLKIDVESIRFNLRYCAATKLAESWPEALQSPSSELVSELPIQSLLSINYIRDLEYLKYTIPHLHIFRIAYRFIKIWAKSRGIYSSRLGYLNDIHITMLLSRVCKLSLREIDVVSALDMLKSFFKYYANFDWKNQMVYDPVYHETAPNYNRSHREPLVILSIHPPRRNIAQSATTNTANTLKDEFKRAGGLFSEPNFAWDDIIRRDRATTTGSDTFLKAFPSYVEFHIHYWGTSIKKWQMYAGWIGLRCVSLLDEINRNFPDIQTRMWPGLFEKYEDANKNQQEHRRCFLIGLSKMDNSSSQLMNLSDRRSAHISLLALLKGFAERTRSDETVFEKKISWVDITLLEQSALTNLRYIDLDWENFTIDQGEEYDEYDEFEDENNTLSKNEITNRPKSAASSTTVTGPKLRPADDVISRLRWDPSFDFNDYVVGYMDRFTGEMEIPISLWKSEKTDEEFIPMHRVLYFKRKSDGQRVWDRQKKIDLIFSTGTTGMAL